MSELALSQHCNIFGLSRLCELGNSEDNFDLVVA